MIRRLKRLIRRTPRATGAFVTAPPECSIIRNPELRRLYEGFLATKEQEGLTMLHREDIYGSGPPVSSPSPLFVDLATRYAGRRVLDVGCGIGVYCRELQQRGHECVGIEFNRDYVAQARKHIDARYMSAENLEFEDQSFDTVIMFEVLEHLKNPDRAMAEIRRVTRTNVVLTVPNLGPIVDCVEHNLIMHHFLEATHYNFFTRTLLDRFLRQFFPEVRVEEIGKFFNLSGKDLFYHLFAVASAEGASGAR